MSSHDTDVDAPALIDLLSMFPDEASAVAYFVKERWPTGVFCTKCGSVDVGRSKARDGLYFCRDCNGKFSVTTGTVMESTKLPLRTWLLAMHLMSGAKKSVSAKYLERALKISYRTAWHLSHRIRAAMRSRDTSKLAGTIESDEKYSGGKRRYHGRGYRGNKAAVQGIVRRGRIWYDGEVEGGRAVSVVLAPDDHKKGDYAHVGTNSGRLVTTNTVEGMFANQERQINGTHHGVSKKHLQRYLDEHDFKYNSSEIADGARMLLALKGVEGRRVTLFKRKGGGGESLIQHKDGDALGSTVDDGEDVRQGRLPRMRPGRKKSGKSTKKKRSIRYGKR